MDLEAVVIEQTVVGDLSARDLGHEVELTDGGATYRGLIEQVQHRRYPYQDTDTSVLFMRTGNWSAHVTVPSETPCTIERDDQPEPAKQRVHTIPQCCDLHEPGESWAPDLCDVTCAECMAILTKPSPPPRDWQSADRA